jgi:hypothetical protein
MRSTFKGLLGTDNKTKQLKKIEELLKIAATPEIGLLIRYNGLDDQITMSIFGGEVTFDILHHMLELTSKAIRREEVNMAAQQQVQAGEDKEPEE